VSQDDYAELARLGSATVYEGAGRRGLIDAPLHQVVPGSRVAGPARIARCAQDDNLMVHAAMAAVTPGDVLVSSTMSWPPRSRVRRANGEAGAVTRRRAHVRPPRIA